MRKRKVGGQPYSISSYRVLYLEILDRDTVFPVSFPNLETEVVVSRGRYCEEIRVNIITLADAELILASRKTKLLKDYRIWVQEGNSPLAIWDPQTIRESKKLEKIRAMRERALAIQERQKRQNLLRNK